VIEDEFDVGHGSEWGEEVGDFVFRRGKRKITDVELVRHAGGLV
jgi:hypothetical protein